MKERRVITYSDERKDDFAGVRKRETKITADFKFVRKNPLWRMLSFVVYRLIMTPFAFIYSKIKYRVKIVRNYTRPPKKGEGCFLYSNHTLADGDAFFPSVMFFPKRVYVVVSPANLSTPGTKNFILMNGAIPVPNNVSAFRGFLNAIEKRILQGACVTIYPEAHIWPYYTEIRPFPASVMRYPVKYNAPVYVSTTTYSEKPGGGKPRVTVYLEGPFYPDTAIPAKQAEYRLCETVEEVMRRNAKHSSYSYIEYRREGAAE